MVDKDKQQETLVDEKQALGIYLESLLRDVPEADEDMPLVAPPVVAPPAPAPAPVVAPPGPRVELEVQAPMPEPEILLSTPPAPPTPPAPVVVEQPLEPAPAPVEVPAEPSPWEGIPEWGEDPFQALLFRLSGLTMAIPLIELDGILEWPDTLTPLPNRSPWYLGLLDNRGKTVPVIELSQLVIPEKIRAKNNPHEVQHSRVILVGGGRWGVACDSVSEVVTLNPDEVRWRSSRTKRKWLAGTAINHMCALLDAEGLVHLLATGQEEPAV